MLILSRVFAADMVLSCPPALTASCVTKPDTGRPPKVSARGLEGAGNGNKHRVRLLHWARGLHAQFQLGAVADASRFRLPYTDVTCPPEKVAAHWRDKPPPVRFL